MAFQTTESELRRLGFKTNSPAQPFPTRAYYAAMQSGNWLVLTPRPGMETACEFNDRSQLVAKHRITSAYDLTESLAGRGTRQRVDQPSRV